MFSRRMKGSNLPGWERAMRTVAGIAMIGYGLFGLTGTSGTMAGYLIAGTGVVAMRLMIREYLVRD